MNARALAARRHLLVASATLQRVRFAHEASALRAAWQPPPWTLPLLAFGLAAALVLLVRRRAPVGVDRPPGWPWLARTLTLWRAARVLARWWATMA